MGGTNWKLLFLIPHSELISIARAVENVNEYPAFHPHLPPYVDNGRLRVLFSIFNSFYFPKSINKSWNRGLPTKAITNRLTIN